jgi:ADP-ribosyl-[dinitrogen reductase] hydrolase
MSTSNTSAALNPTLSRYRGCLIGLATGDAVGTTVEFQRRGSFAPITDMLGGGPFNLAPGQWTDDTSMALCLATSLLEQEGFDAVDQMNRYVKWRNEGYMSSTGSCFDIGCTVNSALNTYSATGNPFSGSTHPQSAGNGCIMRLAPVPMYYARKPEEAANWAMESSRTTHGTEECLDACWLYACILIRALEGADKQQILAATDDGRTLSPAIARIAAGDYTSKSEADISGTGYVVESLEAALWSFYTTDTFKDAILTATNLGDDADTTAAICGQVAGAYYGVDAIPAKWRQQLTLHAEIERMADDLYIAAQLSCG